MGIKEDFLKFSGGEKTIEKWHQYNKSINMTFSDDYFNNVVMAEEKTEEEIKTMPEMFKTDPGLIGGSIDLVDMST